MPVGCAKQKQEMDVLRSVFKAGTACDEPLEPDAKRLKREEGSGEGGKHRSATGGGVTSTSGGGGGGDGDGAGDGGAIADGTPVLPKKEEDLGHYVTREIHLRKQEDDGELVYKTIKNDGNEQHMIWLVTLKNIFSKQLPNMPKEYIVRLVFNPNHHSMICLKNNLVIAGVTYRPFWPQKMGEIAFCAVSANEQVKGYGTRLMNHLKTYVCEQENMTHLITFADNNAVGYFAKQGFTKDVMMDREKWVGYIKEYDGGTIMECHLSAQVSYTDFPVMIRTQRQAVAEKIKQLSSAHLVYPGLSRFLNKPHGSGGVHAPDTYIPASEIMTTVDGLKQAGWVQPGLPKFRLVHPGCGDGTPTRDNLHRFMRSLVALVNGHPDAWPFVDAINPTEVPDYYDVIKDPLYLELIKERVDCGEYYLTLEMFAADFRLLFNNCRLYNSPETVFFKCATRLENFFDGKVQAGISWKSIRGERTERG